MEELIGIIKTWSSYLEEEDNDVEELAEIVQTLIDSGLSQEIALNSIQRVYNITSGMFGA